jgi:hypothetical protein
MSTSDRPELRVDPTTPAGATERVHDRVLARAALPVRESAVPTQADPVAAFTSGHLRAAYTQHVIDPETHEVSVRIRDAATHEVISQLPATEIEALSRSMREYAEALALRHAATQGKAGA